MSARDRLNYFPASPLFTVTRVFDGDLYVAAGLTNIAELQSKPPMPQLHALPPQASPTCSWSPSGICALTLAIYPEAWMTLGGTADGTKMPTALEDALSTPWTSLPNFWRSLCKQLAPQWQEHRQESPGWGGSHRLSDWARHVTTSAFHSGTGRSLRSFERRLRRLTGQSRQSIEFFAKVEDLYAAKVAGPETSLAEMALAADFSDQSHMGRAVKRVTGFAPAQLNRLIENEESFWCYRLLGERF